MENTQTSGQPGRNIDEKEIRGITAKHLIWVFSLLCTILISVVGTYFKITTTIDRNVEQINGIKAAQATMINNTALEVSKLQTQIETLKNNYTALQIELITLEVQLKGKGIIEPEKLK